MFGPRELLEGIQQTGSHLQSHFNYELDTLLVPVVLDGLRWFPVVLDGPSHLKVFPDGSAKVVPDGSRWFYSLSSGCATPR